MTSELVAHYQMLGRYNRLANERLYASCAELVDAARRQDRGAFFRSIHGTLNHIMVGDRIWMARFEGGTAARSRRCCGRPIAPIRSWTCTAW